MREETKHAESIVHRDEDNAFLRERFAVISRFRTGSTRKAAAIREDNHRSALGSGFGSGPDIQVKTVFARCRSCRAATPAAATLHTSRPELFGLANASPSLHGLGRSPAQRADWWLRERYSFEDAN